jgi:hypothetical protein
MDLQPAEKLACEVAGGAGRDTAWWADRAFVSTDEDILEKLERRLGRLHAKQRIGIEDDHEARVFGRGLNFSHPENWRYSPTIIRNALKLTGLYWRAEETPNAFKFGTTKSDWRGCRFRSTALRSSKLATLLVVLQRQPLDHASLDAQRQERLPDVTRPHAHLGLPSELTLASRRRPVRFPASRSQRAGWRRARRRRG